MSERRLRLAVVGLGKMGLLHASLLSVFPEVELVAFCEKSGLMRRLFNKVFAKKTISVVDDVEKLKDLGLDAVYVTTPISSHSFIIKNVYSMGIARNVFTEKTLALDYNQSKELCDISKGFGDINMVGYMKRYSVVFRKAKELLSQGELGNPTRFKAYAFSSDFLGLTKESKSSASRGGALSDLGCHAIDLAMWLFGEIEVQDVLSVVRNEAGSETSVSFSGENSDGLRGQIDVSQSMPGYRLPEFGLSIEFQKGRIDVNDDRVSLTSADGVQRKWYRHDLADSVKFSIGDPEYYRENEAFIKCLLTNRECESNFKDASAVDYVISEVRKRGSGR